MEGLGEREHGHEAAQGEQGDGRDDERDGVALLPGVKAGGDEAPQLPQHDRRGEEEPGPARHLQAQGEGLERVGDEQHARARGSGGQVLDVAVRVHEHGEDGVVEEEAADGAQPHGDDRDHQAPAQLGQVLDQRHLAAGRGRRPVAASGEPEPDSDGRVPSSKASVQRGVPRRRGHRRRHGRGDGLGRSLGDVLGLGLGRR